MRIISYLHLAGNASVTNISSKVLMVISKVSNLSQCLKFQHKAYPGAVKSFILVNQDDAPFYQLRIFKRNITNQSWQSVELILPAQPGRITIKGIALVNGTAITQSCDTLKACNPETEDRCDNGLCVAKRNGSCSADTECGDYSDTNNQTCRKYRRNLE